MNGCCGRTYVSVAISHLISRVREYEKSILDFLRTLNSTIHSPSSIRNEKYPQFAFKNHSKFDEKSAKGFRFYLSFDIRKCFVGGNDSIMPLAEHCLPKKMTSMPRTRTRVFRKPQGYLHYPYFCWNKPKCRHISPMCFSFAYCGWHKK